MYAIRRYSQTTDLESILTAAVAKWITISCLGNRYAIRVKRGGLTSNLDSKKKYIGNTQSEYF